MAPEAPSQCGHRDGELAILKSPKPLLQSFCANGAVALPKPLSRGRWIVESGQEIRKFKAGAKQIWKCLYSPEGHAIVT
jgi:hypothetical protein